MRLVGKPRASAWILFFCTSVFAYVSVCFVFMTTWDLIPYLRLIQVNEQCWDRVCAICACVAWGPWAGPTAALRGLFPPPPCTPPTPPTPPQLQVPLWLSPPTHTVCIANGPPHWPRKKQLHSDRPLYLCTPAKAWLRTLRFMIFGAFVTHPLF